MLCTAVWYISTDWCIRAHAWSADTVWLNESMRSASVTHVLAAGQCVMLVAVAAVVVERRLAGTGGVSTAAAVAEVEATTCAGVVMTAAVVTTPSSDDDVRCDAGD